MCLLNERLRVQSFSSVATFAASVERSLDDTDLDVPRGVLALMGSRGIAQVR